MKLTELLAERERLGKEWVEAGRPASGPIRAALDEVLRQIAAAKRAAAPAPSAAEVAAKADALLDRQWRNEAAAERARAEARYVVWDDFCQTTHAVGLSDCAAWLARNGWPGPRDQEQVLIRAGCGFRDPTRDELAALRQRYDQFVGD